MGRITIFALVDCPHCKRTKSALTERSIPYTEISLTTHPDKRTDMLSLADRLTVPQVFFNERHIGGADDALAVLETWDKERKYATPLERYQKEIELQPDPSDSRLAPPTTPAIVDTPPLPRSDSDKIKLPEADGTLASVLEVTRNLMIALPRQNLPYHGKVYKDSFEGSEGVAALIKIFDLESKDDAIAFGIELQKRHILHHVTNDWTFADSNKFFRLQPFQERRFINSFRVWTDRVDSDAIQLVGRLKKLMGTIESKATDNEGNVDYIAAAEDPDYWVFEEEVCEIQGVKMEHMDETTKLAFGINLYNLMIKHAFIKVGIPTNLTRSSFFHGVAYNIGGDILTFSELENGVLRNNSKAPFALSAPFSKNDARLRLTLGRVDPRVHFGLNCGAKSCPPVKNFTAHAIEEELRIVAMAFCEQDDNVGVEEDKYELRLNKIFSWYQSDFADSTSNLPKAVVHFLRGEKKQKLQDMIENSNKTITVKFNTYDWGTNASKSKSFDCRELHSDSFSAMALLSF